MKHVTTLIPRLLLLVAIVFLTTAMTTTAWGQLKQEENFSYTSGTLLTANGWSAHSGAGTNSEKVSSSGLSFSGYASSAVGNAASFIATGEDVNKTFASFSSGSTGLLYYGAMVRIDTARISANNGDYFFHLYKNSTTFSGRLYIKRKPSDATKFSFGIAKSSTAANVSYSDSIYTTGTTYLVVLKYIVVSGATNDSVQLFVNPTIGASEPTATLTNLTIDIATADLDTVYGVAIRQGSSTTGPSGLIDGIRVGSTWNDIVGSVATPTATTGAASGVTTSAASLAGTIVSNNASTTTSFDYGTSISYGSNATATPSPVNNGYGSTAISVSLSGLSGNTLYHYLASGTNSAGTGTGSDATFTTLTNAPTTTAATSITTSSFTANWSAGSGGAPTSYTIDVSTDIAFGSQIAGYPVTGITGTTQSVVGLSSGTTYYYRVRAVGLANTSSSSNITTVVTVPDAPVATAATSVSTTSFTANWNSSTGATSYRLDVATDAGFTSLVSGYNDLTVAGTSQSVTGLTPNNAYHYRVRAVNGGGTSANSNTIDATTTCPTITVSPSSPLPNGTTGVAYSQTITASGGTAAYTFAVTSGSLPTGLSLASGGGLTGTPTVAGAYSFTVTATDANGCTGSLAYSLTIDCPTITLSPATLPNAQISVAYSQTVSGSGGTPSYTFAIDSGSAPTGLSLSSGGVLSGTPSAGGTFTFRVLATDANGCTGSRTYTIVTSACPVFSFTPAGLPGGVKSTPYTDSVRASNAVAPYTYTVLSGTLPTGLSLSTAGDITGTPTAGGAFSFTVQATDSTGCTDTKSYTIVICEPISQSGLVDGTVGTAYSHTITPTGGTSAYTYTKTTGTLPTGMSLSSGGVLSGTPTAAGTYNFTVVVVDANGCTDSTAWMITMNCPAITLSSYPDGVSGTAYSNTPTPSGGTAPYTYSNTGGTLPAGLTLTGSNGKLSGTPTTPGTYAFAITIIDTYGCTSLVNDTVTVTCPVLTVTTPASDGNVAVAYSFGYTGSGGTGPYSFGSVTGTLPAGLSLSGAGVLSGTPTTATSYIFGFTITDANGCSSIYADTVVITSCPAITVSPASLGSGTQNVAYSQSITASGGASPYTFAVTSGSLPAGVTLSAGGSLSGTPTVHGIFGFTVTATDINGCTGSKAYSLNINCATITVAPASLPNGAPAVAYSQTITASGGAGPYTFAVTAGSLPTGLSLASGGALTGTPTVGGSYTFTVTATSSDGCTGVKSYTVIIVSPAIFKVSATGPSNTPDGLMNITAVDTLYWDSTSTWQIVSGGSATGIPHKNDQVILDHAFRAAAYVVVTGKAGQPAVWDSAAQITVGAPGNTVPVTLLVPPNAPVGAPSNLFFGDGVAGNYDLVIDSGGTVADSKISFLRSVAFNSLNDSVRIRKGGRWYHSTKGFNTMLRIMSRKFDGDYGIVEFDVDGTTPGTFDISGGGNYFYPNVVLSNTHSAPTYYYFGTGATTIKGDLTINPGAKDSMMLTGYPFLHFGNIINNGNIVSNANCQLVFADSTHAQSMSGSGSTALAGGVVTLNPMGVSLSTSLNVTGGVVQTTGDFTYDVTGVGTVFQTLPARGAINTGSSTIFLNPAGALTEGTNPIQGNVSATRTASQNVNETFGSIGTEINAAGGVPGVTTVLRKTGVASTGNGHQSILRYYDISPTNNSALNATLKFYYVPSELNGITETDLLLQKSTNSGTTWSGKTGTVSTPLHNITAVGISGFSRWTAASANAPLFITHTITMRKFADADGNPATSGDQTAKKWRMSLYKDTVAAGTLINTGNPNTGVLATLNLEAGTYIAVEEDSTGWLHLGRVHNGTLIVGASKYDTLVVSGGVPGTIDFINQKVSSVTILKFKDTDGNPNTIESTKKWHLALYQGTVSGGTLVGQADTSLLYAAGIQAGTYIAVESDSGASWTRLNGNHTRYDTLTVIGGAAVVDTFINFRPNSVIATKYNDGDGQFGSAGDRTLKVWYLEIRKNNSGGAVVASGSATSVSGLSLGDGTYYVSEADSAGWIHIGQVVNGVPVAGSSNNATVSVAGGQTATVNFVNAAPVYGQMFRSFKEDSIALDKDNKGKVGKIVKRKADKDYFKFTLTAPGNPTATLALTLKFSMATSGAVTRGLLKTDTIFAWTNLKTVTTPTAIDTHAVIQVDGVGFKGSVIKTTFSWLTTPKATKAAAVASYLINQPKLPMPNRVNALDETFAFGGFASTSGLMVGRDKSVPDSTKFYGWLVSPKTGDVLKTLSDKTGLHTGGPRGFDVFTSSGKPLVKRQKTLPPSKHNNILLANMIALKLNIAASALGKTPAGFGELSYNDTASNSLNGKMLKEIAAIGDSVIMGYDSAGTHKFDGAALSNLNFVVGRVNGAFEGALDTLHFADSLIFKGARTLISVYYLKANPGIVPARIIPLSVPLAQMPVTYELYQNYPNPFNPTTTISFDLPEQAMVTLKIYNMLGQEVAILLDHQQMEDGTQEVQFSANSLASGVYFYRIVAQGFDDDGLNTQAFTTVKKMLLIK